MDWEGGKLRFLLGPPPGFRYCSDMLLCGLLGTKEGGWGGEGGGSLATQWPYHASPPSFTVIMNQDLSGWAEVHASHLTSHKLATQEVNVKLMRGERGEGVGGLGEPEPNNILQNLAWTHCSSSSAASATLCPTLSLQSLSEQAKCASPGKKSNALKNQIAQVELSTEQGYSTTPMPLKAGGIKLSAAHKEYSDS